MFFLDYMSNELEMYEKTIGMNQNKRLVSLIAVLLAMAMAISGFLIYTALANMQDDDPFVAERQYDVSGYCTEGGREVICFGSATTKCASENAEFSTKTFHVKYGPEKADRSFSFSIMFDSDRVPTDLFTYMGTEDGYELWKGSDKGVDALYYIDKDSLIDRVDMEFEDAVLTALARG